MTIRFAPAGKRSPNPLARVLTCPVLAMPANDHDTGLGRDALLRAALRHFAEHGLGAARHAHDNAQRAFFAGDRGEYHRWLAICRTLDRRLADSARAGRQRR